MATKIAATVAVIVMLAVAGTVGVAYYNDPSILESVNAPASAVEHESGSNCCSVSACDSDGSATPAAAQPTCREK